MWFWSLIQLTAPQWQEDSIMSQSLTARDANAHRLPYAATVRIGLLWDRAFHLDLEQRIHEVAHPYFYQVALLYGRLKEHPVSVKVVVA